MSKEGASPPSEKLSDEESEEIFNASVEIATSIESRKLTEEEKAQFKAAVDARE